MDRDNHNNRHGNHRNNRNGDLDDLFSIRTLGANPDWRDFGTIPSPSATTSASSSGGTDGRNNTGLRGERSPLARRRGPSEEVDRYSAAQILRQLDSLGLRIDQVEMGIDDLASYLDMAFRFHTAAAAAAAAPAPITNGERSVPRSLLDLECERLFRTTPVPSRAQLNALLDLLDESFPCNDRKRTRSTIRKWFRKKREKVTHRLIVLFQRRYSEALRVESEREELLKRVRNNEDHIITDFLVHERSALGASEAGLQFAIDRLVSYLCERRI